MSVEAFMKNLLNGDRPSNYDLMAEDARRRFAAMDTEEVSRRTGVPVTEGCFRMILLGREYAVSASDGSVRKADGSPAGHTVSMILYDLLGYAREGAGPSGDYTQVQNLSGAVTASKYAGQGMHDRQAARMDGKDGLLKAACERLSGVPWGKGDVSCLLPLYGDLRFVFSFWDSDDEFPASATILFDSNSLQYMHYETLWYCIGHIFSRLEEEMEAAEKKDRN